MNKNTKVLGLIVILLIVCCAMPITFIISNATSEDLTSQINDTKQKPEKIESVLYQLVKAQKRDDFAEAHGLYLKEGKVRVVIEIENTEVLKIENVLKGYGAVMETYHENLVQALVPVDDLIALSEDPGVNYIRTPLPAHPQKTSEAQIPLIYTWLLIGIVVAIISAIIAVRKAMRGRTKN